MKSFDLGGNGAPLHFIHANGYPPECYAPLFEHLQTQYHIFGMKLRPLWDDAKPEELKDWHPLSDDLLHFLTDSSPRLRTSFGADPVIGVGHSIGAVVTLRAALQDPGKFRALVLIDPVLFVPSFMTQWHILRVLGLGERFHPLIKGAKKRRRIFNDRETIFRGYRSRKIFRYFSDENLKAYIEGITKERSDGNYELVYSPEWEAQIYRTGMHDYDILRDLPKLGVPTLIIRGAETDTFLESIAQLVKRKNPKIEVRTMQKATHLLPLEYPQEVAKLIQSFLADL